MLSRLIKLGMAASAIAMLAANPAAAQQNIRLTIVSGNAPAFASIAAAIGAFIPKVDQLLAKDNKFKITWVQGWSGSIVKPRGELEGIQTGLGDVGVVPGPFFADKLTLFQVGYHTPFTSKDVNVTTDGMNHLMSKFPEMVQQVEKFNQIPLMVAGVADNYVLFTKREVAKYADIKGLKIAAVGANQPWVASAGAIPVATELATQYNAYQTGVFEGIVLWQQAYTAFKMCELGKFRLDVDFGAISPMLLTVNKDSWAKLPDAVKTAFREAAKDWARDTDKRMIDASDSGRQSCQKDHGLKTTSLSAEDRRAWAMAMPNVAQAWAKQQDAVKLPGTAMLGEWMRYMRDRKQPAVRNWDRE